MKCLLRFPRHRTTGAALIITLLFIAVLTVVVVGYLEMVRTEVSTADSHFERMRASALAHSGVENVVATLGQHTTTTGTGGNWISQPGQLVVSPANSQALKTVVPLNSGTSSAAFLATNQDPGLAPTNLNIQTLADQNPPTFLITNRRDASNQPLQMPLRWIYVRKDGSYDTSESPDTTSVGAKTNPVVGRFAYWADDESSKINYNLAWKRNTSATATPNNAMGSDPSLINLMGLGLGDGTSLTEAMADTLHNWTATTPKRYFNSFLDGRQVSPDISSMLDHNKFEVTHYNHDPDTTFFGEDRILLTTNRNLVPHITDSNGKVIYLRRFLDIMRDDLPPGVTSLDPGNPNHIAGGQMVFPNPANPTDSPHILPNKLDAVVKMLMAYVTRTDWPMVPAGSNNSFQYKYFQNSASTDPRIAQFVVNIIDYVRARESPSQLVPPLSFGYGNKAADTVNYQKYSLNYAYTTGYYGYYQGNGRMPIITEMAEWMDDTPNIPNPKPADWPWYNTAYPYHVRMELYLPRTYGIDPSKGIDLVPTKAYPPPVGSPQWFMTFFEYSGLSDSYTPSNGLVSFLWVCPNNNKAISLQTSNGGLPIYASDIILNTGSGGPTVLMPGQRVVIEKLVYRTPVQWAPARDTVYLGRSLIYGLSDSGAIPFKGYSYTGLLLGDYLPEDPLYHPAGDGTLTALQFPAKVSSMQYGRVPYALPHSATYPSRADMPSVETDDPQAARTIEDWHPHATGRNSFGGINSVSTLGTPPDPTIGPQQDTDAKGKLTDASTYMPPPAGTKITYTNQDGSVTVDDNTLGRVLSVGELGYVNTGVTPLASDKSTPYRTLRLQPNNYADTKLPPDWAFMDLFAAPVSGSATLVPNTPVPLEPNNISDAAAALLTPHGTSVGGRVNVNSHVAPFDMTREGALIALLTGAPGLPATGGATTIADNIYQRELATGANAGKAYGHADAFDTSGEICEIKGVADGGEQSENLVRDVASLVTSRGGVFSVYTIGQALKQTPAGKLIVTAEQRQQAVVERYRDNGNTPDDPADDTVRFHTVYCRNLTP
ncbi:MAG: pilus assembly PilX N-terminal domain-containing protein [Terrimicrobiaceae bacterium]